MRGKQDRASRSRSAMRWARALSSRCSRTGFVRAGAGWRCRSSTERRAFRRLPGRLLRRWERRSCSVSACTAAAIAIIWPSRRWATVSSASATAGYRSPDGSRGSPTASAAGYSKAPTTGSISMSSGFADAAVAGWLLLAAGAAEAADLDGLLRSLAREPPQSTAFVETHRSALLDRDLIVSGELEYRGPGQLSRVVTEPYRERTVIDG